MLLMVSIQLVVKKTCFTRGDGEGLRDYKVKSAQKFYDVLRQLPIDLRLLSLLEKAYVPAIIFLSLAIL